MKKILVAFYMIMGYGAVAQSLYNNGASVTITSGGSLYVNGNTVNSAGSINNSGTFNTKGDLTNNATITFAAGNSLQFTGSTLQTIAGSNPVSAKNILLNNPSGIILTTPLRADGVVTFTSGNITASGNAAPMIFSANASIAGSPSDASHVNGFVIKEGTGSFDYPVGDAVKYQKITVALSANAGGISVKYNAADAGSGTFSSGGTEPVPLASYNKNEYWDITPVSTATGNVTLYWDGYNDAFSNPANQRKVAHKVGTNWQNEGTTGIGTITSGSVTSNSVNSWSPFSLGSVVAVLPLKWISIAGTINAQGYSVIDWKVQESEMAAYKVEKSENGIDYQTIAAINGQGAGEHQYSFIETGKLLNTSFYRIMQIDHNGSMLYSNIVKVAAGYKGARIYPTVFKDGFNVYTTKAGIATVIDAAGRVILTKKINAGDTYIDAGYFAAGTYVIVLDSGFRQQVIK